MPAELILQTRARSTDLVARLAELLKARSELSAHAAEVSRLRTRLKAFEDRYFQQAGVLYAELDTLEAQIAEREVDLYDSDSARERARAARRRAQDSCSAAAGESEEAVAFDPPAALKTLFREVAKRIHPDRAADPDEAAYLTLLMARANQAYRRGDTDALQQLLQDHVEHATDEEHREGEAELHRVARQLQHVRRDLAEVLAERDALLGSEIALLHADAEAAAREGRDMVEELAAGLRIQIAEARGRLELVDRQITAHGR